METENHLFITAQSEIAAETVHGPSPYVVIEMKGRGRIQTISAQTLEALLNLQRAVNSATELMYKIERNQNN